LYQKLKTNIKEHGFKLDISLVQICLIISSYY